jgi:hypothetical protein
MSGKGKLVAKNKAVVPIIGTTALPHPEEENDFRNH